MIMKVNEEFLHFIWRHSMYNQRELMDEDGQDLVIIDRGTYNTNAGPDFLEAKIKIGNEIWVGSVEIHMKPSEWYNHRHQYDERYSNVILHVVYLIEGEQEIIRKLNIPTFSLGGRIPRKYLDNYKKLQFYKETLPCRSYVKEMDVELLQVFYESLLIERFEHKLSFIENLYDTNNNDLEETTYQMFAYSWGVKINKEAFLTLSKNTPLRILRKYRSNLSIMEAFLLGQSGLLQNGPSEEAIVSRWEQEYRHLTDLYGLEPMLKTCWYFHRLRPRSFPTIRISLWAKFLFSLYDFGSILINGSLKQCLKILTNLEVSEYWQSHYIFGVESKSGRKRLGKVGAFQILINAVIPLRMFYAKLNHVNAEDWHGALEELSLFAPENNNIVRKMADNGFLNLNAANSQALLQLHQNYCISKKCLNCRIGNEIIRIR